MAPLQPIRKDPSDDRVQPILDFAVATNRSLNNRIEISNKNIRDLETFLEQPFPSYRAVSFARHCSDFDTQGSLLWNSATKILREVDEDGRNSPAVDSMRFAVLLRAFSFFMMDAAHNESSGRTKSIHQRVRIFKVALKAARCCLDNNDLHLAFKLIDRASRYATACEQATPVIRVVDGSVNDEESSIQQLICDFYLLRTAHAAKSRRYDLADHFFLKANPSENSNQDNILEAAAGICFEVGRSQLQQSSKENALVWLERAHKLLDSELLASRSLEHEDLRLAIVASLIEALPNDDHGKRAWDIVARLGEDHGLGNRAAVLVMKLNIVSRSEPADIDTANKILVHMIRSTVLTDQTYLIIMRSVNKVRKMHFFAAYNALEQMICSRLLPDIDSTMDSDQVKDWLQKTIVTYISLGVTASEDDMPLVLEKMSQMFDSIVQWSADALSPKAAHAMQALIWKASKDADAPTADVWLALLQHAIFSNVGAINKAKVARKVMLSSLKRDDFDTARTVFYQMSFSTQNEGMTRYLAYQLALKSGDCELASQCLAVLVKHSERDQKYLYACVLEAQKSDNRAIAVAAFQALTDQPPSSIQLPALLRCTARLLMEELENSQRPSDEVTHELSRIFETAAANMKSLRQASDEQWLSEIQWWSKSAFNLALRLCAEIQPQHLIRLLKVCIRFLDCYPEDDGLLHQADLTQRKQVCHFLCASALVVLARSSPDQSQQLQHYLEVQREVKSFTAVWHQPDDQSSDAELRRTRALEMLKFNVESVFKLEHWENLNDVLTSCLDFQGTARWDTLADLVIIIYDQASQLSVDSSSTAKIPELLQKIINSTWSTDKDILKLARWLRLTFSISLSKSSDDGISIKLVEQAACMARRGTEGRSDSYPEDELQWLATVAFNKAVDLLAIGDREAADQWIEAALELARYAADNGSLHAHLTRNREEAERRLRRR